MKELRQIEEHMDLLEIEELNKDMPGPRSPVSYSHMKSPDPRSESLAVDGEDSNIKSKK